MTTAAAYPHDADLAKAVAPLGAIDPAERVATPPLRLPLDQGRECLVQWQPDSEGGTWSLLLHARPVDPSDTGSPVARLALHLTNPTGEPSADAPSVYWEHADDAFRAWAAARLPVIAADIAARQPEELAALRARSGVGGTVPRKLSGLLPHLVVLGGLAVFAYMFGIVHIK